MFHDKALHDHQFHSLAFDLNAQAFRLAGMVEWYKRHGERTLPVQYLKRLGFTRRQWELATKGSRQYSGRKLVSPAPAQDGCEAIGLISEYIDICPETRKPKTYWVIGAIDQDAIAHIRKMRDEEQFDVIEDPRPDDPDETQREETSAPAGSRRSDEQAYDDGYQQGLADGYDRCLRETEATGCVKNASLVSAHRDAFLTHPVNPYSPCDALRFEISAEILDERLDRLRRAESEKELGF